MKTGIMTVSSFQKTVHSFLSSIVSETVFKRMQRWQRHMTDEQFREGWISSNDDVERLVEFICQNTTSPVHKLQTAVRKTPIEIQCYLGARIVDSHGKYSNLHPDTEIEVPDNFPDSLRKLLIWDYRNT